MPTIEIRPTVILDQQFGFTPENVTNKSIDGALAANSATLYPSQSAVKTYADSKVEDLLVDGVLTRAPSQNVVFDALGTKQNNLVSGTTIKTIDSASILGAGNISTLRPDYNIRGYRAFGSNYQAETLAFPFWTCNTAITLTNQTQFLSPLFIPSDQTISGVYLWSRVQGVFTGNLENSLSLYSLNISGDITRIAITANNENIWKVAANARGSFAFVTPVSVTTGIYLVGGLFNASVITTAPQIAGGTPLNNAAMATPDTLKMFATRAAQAAQGTPITFAQQTASVNTTWFAVY